MLTLRTAACAAALLGLFTAAFAPSAQAGLFDRKKKTIIATTQNNHETLLQKDVTGGDSNRIHTGPAWQGKVMDKLIDGSTGTAFDVKTMKKIDQVGNGLLIKVNGDMKGDIRDTIQYGNVLSTTGHAVGYNRFGHDYTVVGSSNSENATTQSQQADAANKSENEDGGDDNSLDVNAGNRMR